MRLPARAATAVLATLLAAACAPGHRAPAASGQDVGHAAGVLYGTIVAMRPLAAQASNAGTGDVRATILDAIGGVAGNVAGNQPDRGPAAEFIVRADTGETVSIVQTARENFRPGERVAITRGAGARLAPGTPSPPPGA